MSFRMQIANLFATFSADTKPFDKDMKRSVSALRRQAEDLTQAGRIISTSITLPLLAAGAASAKFAMDFETGMTKIITLVGMSRETIEEWTPAVRRMASEVGVTTSELGEALFYITSAGIRTTAALDVLEASAKAAAIGLGDTKSVAYAAVSAMNAYGQSNLTAKKAVAVLISTVREGNMEAKSLPMAFGRVLPVASELGIAFDDVGASIAMMTRSGVTARLAAFALRSILMTMIRPTHESKVAIRELGMTWEQVRQIASKDGPGGGLLTALQEIKKAAGGNAQAFARVIPNSRAFIGALQLVGDKAEYTRTVFDSLNSTTESLVDETFREFSKTAQANVSKSLASLSESAVIFGQTLLPVAEGLLMSAKALNVLAEGFGKIPVPMRIFIQGLMASVATLGVGIVALGQYRRLQASLPTIIGAATGSIQAQGAAITMSSARLGAAQAATIKLTKGMQALSVASAGFAIGLNIGQALDKWLGITERISKVFLDAKDPVTEFGEELAKSEKKFNSARVSTLNLANALNHSSAEWLKNTTHTQKNSKKLAELHDELSRLHSARIQQINDTKELTAREKHHLEFMSDEQKLLAAKLTQMAELNKETREEYDLMTSPEVRTALDDLAKKYKNVIKQGIPLPRVWKEMQSDIEDTLGWQNDYNEAAPQWVRDVADELEKTGNAGLTEYIKELDEKLPQTVNAMPGKLLPGFEEIKESVGGALEGGFGTGIDKGIAMFDTREQQIRDAISAPLGQGFGDGFTDARTQYEEFANWLKDQPLEVQIEINKESLVEALNEWADGKYPDTGG